MFSYAAKTSTALLASIFFMHTFSGCTKQNAAPAPPPLDEETVARWKNAGAQPKWIGIAGGQVELDHEDGAKDLEGRLPGFVAASRRLDFLADMPEPKSAFAFSIESRLNLTAEEIRLLARFRHLEFLDIGFCIITDPTLKEIAKLTSLRRLRIENTDRRLWRITDEGFAELKTLQNLEYLQLAGTDAVQDSLAILSEMPKLRTLTLTFFILTEKSSQHLSKLKQIRELHLGETKITDVSLQHLSGLTNLQVLNLNEENLTNAGIERLRKQLPNTKIEDRRNSIP